MLAHVSLLGSLPQWFTALLAAAIAWRISRGGGSGAVSELDRANQVLARRMHALDQENQKQATELGELRQRTDFQAVLAEHERRAQQRHVVLAEHERRAQQRHEAQLHVLALIAERLGPDREET